MACALLRSFGVDSCAQQEFARLRIIRQVKTKRKTQPSARHTGIVPVFKNSGEWSIIPPPPEYSRLQIQKV
jgi:hypothetical protein